MPYQHFNAGDDGDPDSCVSDPTDEIFGGTQGGMGIRWIGNDPDCETCVGNDNGIEGDKECCCEFVRNRFSSPQVLGIGIISNDIDPSTSQFWNNFGRDDENNPITSLGTRYMVDLYLTITTMGKGVTESYEGGYWEDIDKHLVPVYNLSEEEFGDNGAGRCACPTILNDCDETNYIPNIQPYDENVSGGYPSNFHPQRLCNGMSVTIMGVTREGAGSNDLSYPHDPGLPDDWWVSINGLGLTVLIVYSGQESTPHTVSAPSQVPSRMVQPDSVTLRHPKGPQHAPTAQGLSLQTVFAPSQVSTLAIQSDSVTLRHSSSPQHAPNREVSHGVPSSLPHALILKTNE